MTEREQRYCEMDTAFKKFCGISQNVVGFGWWASTYL